MIWLNAFSAEILLQELPLDGGFAWPTIYFNIIWKEMLFTRCAILQWNTHQAFIALWFLSFTYCYSFVRHAYHHLDEQAFNTAREFWLLLMVDCNDGNYCSIPPTLDGWVYIEPIHGPLDGPLNTGAQYTPTPPRSLNYRRNGVQDWTTRKPTQHPPQFELPSQRCSRLDKKKVQRANTPSPQPQLATCYVEAGAKLREGRGE